LLLSLATQFIDPDIERLDETLDQALADMALPSQRDTLQLVR